MHGALKHALLGRLLHEWAGEGGKVKRVACQYRGMDMIAKDVTCRGVVTGKRSEDGRHVVELEVWTEDPKGNKTTPGTAVVESIVNAFAVSARLSRAALGEARGNAATGFAKKRFGASERCGRSG